METFFGGSGLSAGGIAPYLAVESVGWKEYFRGPQGFDFFCRARGGGGPRGVLGCNFWSGSV